MNRVYNKLIFREIFNLNFQGSWYIKVMSVNKDDENATLILDMSSRHMIKWPTQITPSWHAFDIIWNIASKNLSTDSEGSVFQVLEGVVYYVDPTSSSNAMNAFVGSKECVCIPLSGICKALGRTCRPQRVNSILYSLCHCLLRPIKVLPKTLFLHIRSTLKDCK